jgi:prolyl 4-hydroxylase
MHKDLTQDKLDWIFKNIKKDSNENELLEALLVEGFNISQCKIALGLDLGIEDLVQAKEVPLIQHNYSSNKSISVSNIKNVPAEIYEVENFLSKKDCQRLIDEIISQLRPSTIASSGEYDPTFRTSSTCDLGYKNTSFIDAIDKKICDFIGIDISYGEVLQGQHYLEGQEFKEHTDYFDAEQLIDHDKGRGQRTYTFMIYLNNVLEGGETEFPKLNRMFSPKAGKALIWNNLNEDSTLNGNTTHQAHPVQKGNKTIVTKWFREKFKN